MKLLKGLTSGKNKYLKIGIIAVALAGALYFGPKLLKNKTSGRVPTSIMSSMPSPAVAAMPPIAAPTGLMPSYTPAGAFRANARVGISPMRQKVLI